MDNIQRIIRLGFLLSLVIALSQASCGFGPPKYETTHYGRRVTYCEYKNLKMLPESRFIDKDACQVVSCTSSGLSTCGHGFKAGVFAPPAGCELVNDGCEPLFVPRPGSGATC